MSSHFWFRRKLVCVSVKAVRLRSVLPERNRRLLTRPECSGSLPSWQSSSSTPFNQLPPSIPAQMSSVRFAECCRFASRRSPKRSQRCAARIWFNRGLPLCHVGDVFVDFWGRGFRSKTTSKGRALIVHKIIDPTKFPTAGPLDLIPRKDAWLLIATVCGSWPPSNNTVALLARTLSLEWILPLPEGSSAARN